jgi:hypothetical protein
MNTSTLVVGAAGLGLVFWLLSKKGNIAMGSPSTGTPAAENTQRIFSTGRLTRTQIEMGDLITDKARAAGLNPAFMIALAVTESSLDPRSTGDDGLSLGLFQLNKKFIVATDQELLDADFNAESAMEKMNLLLRSFPGHTYGDYAEAWALGGAGRFRRMRRLPAKLANMENAVRDLSLSLSLQEVV